jgi:hypothetical protein
MIGDMRDKNEQVNVTVKVSGNGTNVFQEYASTTIGPYRLSSQDAILRNAIELYCPFAQFALYGQRYYESLRYADRNKE